MAIRIFNILVYGLGSLMLLLAVAGCEAAIWMDPSVTLAGGLVLTAFVVFCLIIILLLIASMVFES